MAFEFYVTITGSKQTFKGESDRAAYKDKIPGLSFVGGVSSPRDATTGQATGKRRHEPVVIRKKVGSQSPLIIKALTSNEILKTVKFEFVNTSKEGKETIFYKITLTNATIASHKMVLPDVLSDDTNLELYEEISFTFQKIEWSHEIAKTITTDDWAGDN